MNASAESLDHDAHRRQRQERVKREPGTDGDHEGQRARGVDEGVGRVHDGGAEQHADRVQVVGGARHNVAGAVTLVVGVRKDFQTREQIVAQVELYVARDADHDPAGEELEDSLGDGDGKQHCRVEKQFVPSYSFMQIVGSLAEHQRKEDPDAVREKDAECARGVTPAVAFQIRQQRAQTLRQHVNPVDEILTGAVQGSRSAGSATRGHVIVANLVPGVALADSLSAIA